MKKRKGAKVKLLPHEVDLVQRGELTEVTHDGATARWLEAPSTSAKLLPSDHVAVYRPMGDLEANYLLEHGALPSTQPYQAIIEGPTGRAYAEKFLRGHKKVDTAPTTVVEFVVPAKLVEDLMARQCKVEDGAISMGLGNKAGNGLSLFNEALQLPSSGFRIVLVKRRAN